MIMKNLIIYIFTCLVLSCAVKGPPSGGPLDINSPYIVSINPIDGKINLELDEKIEIIFNEMLDPNTIKSSIVVKPVNAIKYIKKASDSLLILLSLKTLNKPLKGFDLVFLINFEFLPEGFVSGR